MKHYQVDRYTLLLVTSVGIYFSYRAQPPSSLMLRGHTASKKWVLSDPSGEESTRFLLNLPRHNQLVSGEHNSPPNPNQRTPLAGGVPHTCAPLFLLSKWLLMTWLSRSRSFSDDIATSLMIKFWGNENSKSLIALDCPAKWWVHCCGYPRWENAPLNVQKPFLVCNGPITSIFPDFKT